VVGGEYRLEFRGRGGRQELPLVGSFRFRQVLRVLRELFRGVAQRVEAQACQFQPILQRRILQGGVVDAVHHGGRERTAVGIAAGAVDEGEQDDASRKDVVQAARLPARVDYRAVGCVTKRRQLIGTGLRSGEGQPAPSGGEDLHLGLCIRSGLFVRAGRSSRRQAQCRQQAPGREADPATCW